MNETRRPWTSAGEGHAFRGSGAVARHRQAGSIGTLIAATVPWAQRKSRTSAVHYQLFAAHTLMRIRAPAAPVSPPPSVFRRPCLRCRRPFELLGSKAGIGSAVRARKGSLRLGRSPPDPHTAQTAPGSRRRKPAD